MFKVNENNNISVLIKNESKKVKQKEIKLKMLQSTMERVKVLFLP